MGTKNSCVVAYEFEFRYFSQNVVTNMFHCNMSMD